MRKKGWKERAKKVRLLLLDVDGVLTDGHLVYDGQGKEVKFFHIRDGQGIKMLQRAGIAVGILSGRRSKAVEVRAQELGIERVFQGVRDKARVLETLLKKEKLRAEEICFVGDDLVDLPVLSRVGLAVAVSDSVEEAKALSQYTTRCPGGRGAVREVCELILKAQGKWGGVIREFFPPGSFL